MKSSVYLTAKNYQKPILKIALTPSVTVGGKIKDLQNKSSIFGDHWPRSNFPRWCLWWWKNLIRSRRCTRRRPASSWVYLSRTARAVCTPLETRITHHQTTQMSPSPYRTTSTLATLAPSSATTGIATSHSQTHSDSTISSRVLSEDATNASGSAFGMSTKATRVWGNISRATTPRSAWVKLKHWGWLFGTSSSYRALSWTVMKERKRTIVENRRKKKVVTIAAREMRNKHHLFRLLSNNFNFSASCRQLVVALFCKTVIWVALWTTHHPFCSRSFMNEHLLVLKRRSFYQIIINSWNMADYRDCDECWILR